MSKLKKEKTKAPRKDAAALKKFIGSHTRHEVPVVLDKISKDCMVPRYTIYNWQYGLARIPELHKRKIEEIFGQKIFD